MFTEREQSELIGCGWSPRFDDEMVVVGFDRWVHVGDAVVVPEDCGTLIQFAALKFNSHGQVVAQQFGVRPREKKRKKASAIA